MTEATTTLTRAAWDNYGNLLSITDPEGGITQYTHDALGNTLSQTDANNAANTRSYVYDTDNRLIEVHDASNAIIASYRYDPFGRRISKTLNNGSQSNTTYYFYSAEGLIAEADSNGQLTKSYGYAPGSTFSTNPLWMKVPASGTQTTATYYTYQNDHLGTPMKLLNQSGVTVWSATYDAFGRATVDAASTVTNNFRYPGQYYDAETGLHYNWMRYYDPNTGRYVTSDPIGLRGGINEYTYVNGNTLRWIDPNGLKMFCFPGMKCWSDKIPPTDKIPPKEPTSPGKPNQKEQGDECSKQPVLENCIQCCSFRNRFNPNMITPCVINSCTDPRGITKLDDPPALCKVS